MPGTLQAARLQSQGRLTLPAAIRAKLGVEAGDLISFVETEAGIMLVPHKRAKLDNSRIEQLRAALRQRGPK